MQISGDIRLSYYIWGEGREFGPHMIMDHPVVLDMSQLKITFIFFWGNDSILCNNLVVSDAYNS